MLEDSMTASLLDPCPDTPKLKLYKEVSEPQFPHVWIKAVMCLGKLQHNNVLFK